MMNIERKQFTYCKYFKAFFAASVWIIGATLIVGCNGSVEEQKRFKSNFLAAEISSWIHLGTKDADLTSMQFTNKAVDMRLFRYQTNIVVNGISYETVLKFEGADFGGKGYLLAARDGTVIWVGSDGKREITCPRK